MEVGRCGVSETHDEGVVHQVEVGGESYMYVGQVYVDGCYYS